MKKKRTALLFAALALALALCLAGCSKPAAETGGAADNGETVQESGEAAPDGTAESSETAQESGETAQESSETAEADGQQPSELSGVENLSNGGLILPVPLEYRDLLLIDTPEDGADGELFTITEKASREAEDYEGVGWICSIARVSREKLNEMLCYDMSGAEVIAKDGDGNCYVFHHPTDVTFARESYDDIEEDMAQWSALNAWAGTLRDGFPEANGLTPERRSNTELDMFLSRIAYMEGTSYTISTTEYGPLEPGDVDPAPYLDRLTGGVLYESAYGEAAPDGEYVVLNFPEDEVRFDFFSADENCIRQVWGENGEDEMILKADFADGGTTAYAVMQEWYDALAAAQGLVG